VRRRSDDGCDDNEAETLVVGREDVRRRFGGGDPDHVFVSIHVVAPMLERFGIIGGNFQFFSGFSKLSAD
jgi:hypothetical protein